METKNKIYSESVTELPMVEAYMRWALDAAEEMMGKTALDKLLSENNLGQFVDHYPPDKMALSQTITLKEYANLMTALMQFYGSSSSTELVRWGRLSAKPALENQGKLFNMAARAALKFLPMSMQIKTVLEALQSDQDKIYKDVNHDVGVKIEDRGETWAYIDQSCAYCAGKVADAPICWGWVGTLEESLNWLTGKEFEVKQVECRTMGASACVWEVDKKPKK